MEAYYVEFLFREILKLQEALRALTERLERGQTLEEQIMEPQEAEELMRRLIAIAAHQERASERHDLTLQELRLLNQQLQVTMQHQELINQRLTIAIERTFVHLERLEATVTAIKDLLERRQN